MVRSRPHQDGVAELRGAGLVRRSTPSRAYRRPSGSVRPCLPSSAVGIPSAPWDDASACAAVNKTFRGCSAKHAGAVNPLAQSIKSGLGHFLQPPLTISRLCEPTTPTGDGLDWFLDQTLPLVLCFSEQGRGPRSKSQAAIKGKGVTVVTGTRTRTAAGLPSLRRKGFRFWRCWKSRVCGGHSLRLFFRSLERTGRRLSQTRCKPQQNVR